MSDKYACLSALKANEAKGTYKIRCIDRQSRVTIASPHGGNIEPGTSALTTAVAGHTYNLFDFQGLVRKNAFDLHVTSTHFRDPQLSKLLVKSNTTVSFHGMGQREKATIWLGGLNLPLKEAVLRNLLALNFDVNPDSPMYRGESPRNFVNMTARHGVQLELSTELVVQLFKGKPFLVSGRSPRTTSRFDDLVCVVRKAIAQDIKAEASKAG